MDCGYKLPRANALNVLNALKKKRVQEEVVRQKNLPPGWFDRNQSLEQGISKCQE